MSNAYAFGLNQTGILNVEGCVDRSGAAFGSFTDHIHTAVEAVQENIPNFFAEAVESCTGAINKTLVCELDSEQGSAIETFGIHLKSNVSAASQLFLNKFDDEKCLLSAALVRAFMVVSYLIGALLLCFFCGYISTRCQKRRVSSLLAQPDYGTNAAHIVANEAAGRDNPAIPLILPANEVRSARHCSSVSMD